MSEIAREVLDYNSPGVLHESAANVQYTVLQAVQNSKGYWETNDDLELNINTDAGVFVDTHHSYILGTDEVFQQWVDPVGGVNPNEVWRDQNRSFSRGVGVPFDSVLEQINNRTMTLNDLPNNLNRWVGVELLTSKKRAVYGQVTEYKEWNGGAPTTSGLTALGVQPMATNISYMNLGISGMGCDDPLSRVQSVVSVSPASDPAKGFPGQRYAFKIPLPYISALASSNRYVPAYLLGSGGSDAWYLKFKVITPQQWCLSLNPDTTNQLPNLSWVVRLRNVVVFLKTVKIHDPSITQSVYHKYLQLPVPKLELDGSGELVEDLKPSSIVMPFKFVQYRQTLLTAGQQSARIVDKVNARDLRAIAIRIRDQNTRNYKAAPALSDIQMQGLVTQYGMTIGDMPIPNAAIQAVSNPMVLLAYLNAFYNSSKHLFNSGLEVGAEDEGALGQFYTANTDFIDDSTEVFDHGAKNPSILLISLESFTPAPANGKNYQFESCGIDTAVHRDTIAHDFTFNAPLANNLLFDVFYLSSELLKIASVGVSKVTGDYIQI